MNWRPFDYDPATGIRTWFAHDPVEKKNHFKSEQDVTAILDNNQALYTHDDKGWSKSREWRRVAEIPLTAIMEFETRYGVNPLLTKDQKVLRKMLNDLDYRKFRTAPGRV